MRYVKVRWLHSLAGEPVILYSEIDGERWERRKVYVFADGSHRFAPPDDEVNSVFLSIEPLPSLLEIAADPQFLPEEIEKEEFEDIWHRAHL